MVESEMVGNQPFGVAVTPDSKVYVANFNDNTVSVIAKADGAQHDPRRPYLHCVWYIHSTAEREFREGCLQNGGWRKHPLRCEIPGLQKDAFPSQPKARHRVAPSSTTAPLRSWPI